MRELLQQYFNIAFLMGKPQDLRGDADQVKIGVALAIITYVMALTVPYGLPKALLQAVIDLVCTAVVLHIALSAMGLKNRFAQAFGGLCGASAFINLAALPLYALRPVGQSSSFVLADFVLLVWGLSLLGHVIRHTFEVSLVVSIIISFVYFVVLSSFISALLPQPFALDDALSMLDYGSIVACLHANFGSVA